MYLWCRSWSSWSVTTGGGRGATGPHVSSHTFSRLNSPLDMPLSDRSSSSSSSGGHRRAFLPDEFESDPVRFQPSSNSFHKHMLPESRCTAVSWCVVRVMRVMLSHGGGKILFQFLRIYYNIMIIVIMIVIALCDTRNTIILLCADNYTRNTHSAAPTRRRRMRASSVQTAFSACPAAIYYGGNLSPATWILR